MRTALSEYHNRVQDDKREKPTSSDSALVPECAWFPGMTIADLTRVAEVYATEVEDCAQHGDNPFWQRRRARAAIRQYVLRKQR